MSELVVESFTNELGQTIDPGDAVLFAGSSWSITSINKGTFAGVRYGNVTRYRVMKDADGNDVMHEQYGRKYPKQERYVTREVVNVRIENVPNGFKYEYVDNPETGKSEYTRTDEMTYRTSTLRLNRVYKLDTTLAAVNKIAVDIPLESV